MAYGADDDRPTRTERKRRERAIIDESRQVLEDFIQVPDHKMRPLNVDPSSHDDLMLLRRLKPSKARLRLLKNLAERLDEDEMDALRALISGESASGPSEQGHIKDVNQEWLDRLMAPGEEALQEIRQARPDADHQHLRQLVLRSRRSPKSAPAKSARAKLLKFLGELQLQSE